MNHDEHNGFSNVSLKGRNDNCFIQIIFSAHFRMENLYNKPGAQIKINAHSVWHRFESILLPWNVLNHGSPNRKSGSVRFSNQGAKILTSTWVNRLVRACALEKLFLDKRDERTGWQRSYNRYD